jgi:hypothetical protein
MIYWVWEENNGEVSSSNFGSMADYFFETQISNNRHLKMSSCLPAQSDIFIYEYQSPNAVRSDEQMKHVNTMCVCVCVCVCVEGGAKSQNVVKLKCWYILWRKYCL